LIYTATLKKPWRSPRGKEYPVGSTFEFLKKFHHTNSALYEFKIPEKCYGVAVLPNSIYDKLTAEQKELKREREKMRSKHIEVCQNAWLNNTKIF